MRAVFRLVARERDSSWSLRMMAQILGRQWQLRSG
jgi:hypothetical protein